MCNETAYKVVSLCLRNLPPIKYNFLNVPLITTCTSFRVKDEITLFVPVSLLSLCKSY